MKKNESIGICSLLTIVFVALKLFGAINWSWWWVVSPLWIPWAIILGFATICSIFAGLMVIVALVLSIMSAIISSES